MRSTHAIPIILDAFDAMEESFLEMEYVSNVSY